MQVGKIGNYQPYTLWQIRILAKKDVFSAKICPFIREVRPEIAEIQRVDNGLSLICIDGKKPCQLEGKCHANHCLPEAILQESEQVTLIGLLPLIKAGVLTEDTGKKIQDWFKSTSCRIKEVGKIYEYIVVDGHKYTIYTYAGKNSRCLVLGLGHLKF